MNSADRGAVNPTAQEFLIFLRKKTEFFADGYVLDRFSSALSRLGTSSTTTTGGANCCRKYAIADGTSCIERGKVAPAAFGCPPPISFSANLIASPLLLLKL